MSPRIKDTEFEEQIQQTEERKAPVQEAQPVTLVTELDAYISERIKGQPKNLAEIEVETKEERLGIHRLSLPEYFEPLSYDCTKGLSCQYHGWASERVTVNVDLKQTILHWKQSKHGNFIFRWLNSDKRSIDNAVNVKGWFIVNRTLFQEAPRILFSVSGGVEEGANILAFMSVKKAIAIRNEPALKSRERVKAETLKHKDNPNFYEAKLTPEKAEGDDYAPSDARQEGRDF